jgi:hypothetical protein
LFLFSAHSSHSSLISVASIQPHTHICFSIFFLFLLLFISCWFSTCLLLSLLYEAGISYWIWFLVLWNVHFLSSGH